MKNEWELQKQFDKSEVSINKIDLQNKVPDLFIDVHKWYINRIHIDKDYWCSVKQVFLSLGVMTNGPNNIFPD